MNKTILIVLASIFGLIGGYVPFLFGETDIFSLWSIVGGTVGGLFGIWVGVWVSKRIE